VLSVLSEPGLLYTSGVRKFRTRNGNGKAVAVPDKRGGGYVLERAYEALLGAIRQNKFQPGQRLLETQICEWLHISRTPVREAMRRLQAQGLLEHRPGGGVTVCLHDFHAVAELYVFRETLEGTAAGLAAQHADKTEIDLLMALVKIQQDLPQDAEIHARENKVFHDHLYRAAHNQFLLKSLQSLHESVALLGRTTLSVPGRIDVAVREHGEIVSAIVARDPQRAQDMARQHVRNSYQARVRLIMEALDLAARLPVEVDTQQETDSRRNH
jgi:DNA-binding GntR family transcriptional regulator